MFLRKVDMLSPKITLYYKQKNTHASVISGILTIIVCTLIITFATIYFVRYANKENPTAYFYNRYIDDIGTFSFKENHFFNFVQLSSVSHISATEFSDHSSQSSPQPSGLPCYLLFVQRFQHRR